MAGQPEKTVAVCQCDLPMHDAVDVERDVVAVEIWPTAPESEQDPSSPDPTPTQDQKYNSQVKVSLLLPIRTASASCLC